MKADCLHELDTRELDLLYGGVNGSDDDAIGNAKVNKRRPAKKMYGVNRTRDVVKSFTAMTDSDTAYVVLAIEAQSHIHYAMPVRNMLYDALQYSGQVQK
ncbi:MAG: hypothetical protein ACI4R6_03345, partial [Lachnospiraceae bacterium]